MAPPEISVTKSRTDCDLTQQMVGGIKASSPGMKSMSADMFLDLLTMSAPSGEERKLGAAAQVERAGLSVPHPPRNLDSKSTTYPSLSVPEPPESRLELQERSGCRGLVSSCL